MATWGIKLDKADIAFSHYIRLRDGKCLRCGSIVSLNDKGLPVTHQASHFFGRRNESTRYSPENVDTLCAACHQYWGSQNHEDYRAFKIKQLGDKGFKLLCYSVNQYCKKDRKMAYIRAKAMLDNILK